MKTNIKKIILIVSTIIITNILLTTGVNASSKIVYPLQKVSRLECRYSDFSELKNDCIEDFDILKTKDYKKYANQNNGYNKFTRRYSVLWGASYKYGWDVGHGGHMGVDIVTAKGTPIYAIADGVVNVAGWKAGLGNMVAITHNINGKTIVSNYGHMSQVIAKKGQKVKAGDLIGKVGSTGNSTGNHLHLQIDTKTTYSPIYYNYKTCPYNYNKIIEEGICFDELTTITLDPLKFLETNGGILNNVEIKINDTGTNQTYTKNITTKSSIFDRTVYVGYSYGDIREVQTIYKSLGYYKGEINGNYRDVEKSIIAYQLDKGVIKNKGEDGAGWFGPKTRAQTKKDWKIFLDKGGKVATTEIIGEKNNNNSENVVSVKTEKIDRKNMLTREEIEKREVEDFVKLFNINLDFANPGGAVKKGETEILKLNITDSRGKPFRGNMPGSMTFITNQNTIKTFPEKLYFFTDGKRDIKITGLKEGITTLYIKIGSITLKSFNIKVYNGNKTIYPESSQLYIPNSSVMGEKITGLAVFKDKNSRNMINIPFASTYKLKASNGNKICIKKGNVNDIKRVFNSKCRDTEFKEEITFNYDDTISGILIFDFQVLNKNAKFEIVNTYKNKQMVVKKVSMGLPKGLAKNYEYKDEVMKSIEKGITTTSIKKGYFKQEWKLNEEEAYSWIENTLYSMKNETGNSNLKMKIENNISEIQRKSISRSKIITRGELLGLSYKYLVFDGLNNDINRNYKDLSEGENKIANTIFNKNTTWKDKFGENYFRPDEEITRGEGAYLLVKTLENTNTNLLTLKY